MTLSYFLLSGEHPSLPYTELCSVLGLYGLDGQVELLDGRVAVADVPSEIHQEICMRTAYTRSTGFILSMQPVGGDHTPDISPSKELLETLVNQPTTFRTEVVELGGAEVDSMMIERLYGGQLMKMSGKLKVSLKNPEMVFLAIYTPNYVVAGLQHTRKPPNFFTSRRAKFRPFKIPSTLQPKLARCMVNLATQKLDSWVYDPFAGAGAILIEAMLLGHKAVGTELKTWIADGLLRNIRYYAGDHVVIVQADARRPPFRRRFDAVVTDPPYGRSSTIPGKSLNRLLEDFFNSLLPLLAEDGRICITLPTTHQTVLEEIGLKILSMHEIYIHKRLTRMLAVLST